MLGDQVLATVPVNGTGRATVVLDTLTVSAVLTQSKRCIWQPNRTWPV